MPWNAALIMPPQYPHIIAIPLLVSSISPGRCVPQIIFPKNSALGIRDGVDHLPGIGINRIFMHCFYRAMLTAGFRYRLIQMRVGQLHGNIDGTCRNDCRGFRILRLVNKTSARKNSAPIIDECPDLTYPWN